MTSFQPPRARYQAAYSGAISEIDEVKSRLTTVLEPLPLNKESMPHTNNAVKSKITYGLEPLPACGNIPYDEFASYIGDAIQVL